LTKATGRPRGRPPTPKPPTPSPRPPADTIERTLWDMAEEAAKPKPNPTRAGLYREQLAAQTRLQDRDDAIARDQQRIELEQLRKDHIGYKSQIADLEKTCKSWLTECDGLRANLIQVEASAAHDLAQCPSCVRLEKEISL
jgi:hypothetical protein